MNWVIKEKLTCEFLTFESTNFGGRMSRIQVFPSGRQGEVEGTVGSVIVAGSFGLRIIFCEAPSEDDWESRPWRAVVMTKGKCFRSKEGRLNIRVPNLDTIDEPNALRASSDFESSYDHVDHAIDGKGWTYGRTGMLAGRVKTIIIDRVPED